MKKVNYSSQRILIMEKIKKELLTEENIKKDLLVTSYDEVEKTSEPLYYLMYVLFGVGIILSFLLHPLYLIMIPAAYIIIPPIVFIKDRIKYKARQKELIEGGFTVREDTLSHINVETVRLSHSGRMFSRKPFGLSESYVFYFNSGEWIPRECSGKFYKWSNNYYMSLGGIYNTSLEGDEFYIVERGLDGKIGCIYNKKFFEYKKQISE